MQIAAKSMNMTTKEFLKAMEEGKVAAEDFLPAFSEAMRELAAPGLEKAFKSVSFAQKKMMAEWKLFKNALFTAGLDKLFKSLFHTIEDLLVVMKPAMTFLVAALTSFIRAVLFPIKLVLAVVADLFDLIDYYMKKFLGFDLTDVAETLGNIVGVIASLFVGAVGAISKVVRLIVKNSYLFKVIGTGFEIASKYATKLFNIVSKLVDKLKQIPVIGKLFKGDVSGAVEGASKAAQRVAAGKRMDTFLDKGAMLGSAVVGGNALSGLVAGKSIVELFLRGDAKEMFDAKTDDKTTERMNVNTRG